jgi:uncharacterized protein YndB with AHSA1/START domain
MEAIYKAKLQIKRVIEAPRERLYRAWTNPQELMRWFSPTDQILVHKVEVDARPGGRYRIEMLKEGKTIVVSGVYREVRPPERLVFTWAWQEWEPGWDSVVAVELRDLGHSTELVLTHELFPSAEERSRHERGWNGALERLGQMLA